MRGNIFIENTMNCNLFYVYNDVYYLFTFSSKVSKFGHVTVKYYIIFYKHVELVTGKQSCNNSTYMFICYWSVKLEQINSIAREDLPRGNDFSKKKIVVFDRP